MMYSVFVGSCFSTSFFKRRSKKGRKIEWSFVRISWLIGKFFCKAYCMGIENHSMKSECESKIRGIKKCSKDQSSPTSFCKGVPVKRSRCFVWKLKSTCHLWDLKFLMCCASSRTMKYHFLRLKIFWSYNAILYEVMQTWKWFILLQPARFCLRSFGDP